MEESVVELPKTYDPEGKSVTIDVKGPPKFITFKDRKFTIVKKNAEIGLFTVDIVLTDADGKSSNWKQTFEIIDSS